MASGKLSLWGHTRDWKVNKGGWSCGHLANNYGKLGPHFVIWLLCERIRRISAHDYHVTTYTICLPLSPQYFTFSVWMNKSKKMEMEWILLYSAFE